jgi:type IV pilus assembly protein PilW
MRERIGFHFKYTGFSLVEVLVGMTVSLLGMIVIFQVFSVSQGYKQATTSSGDSQQNGALALYGLQRDIRMAGFGVAAGMNSSTGGYSCSKDGVYRQVEGWLQVSKPGSTDPGTASSFWLAPVIITNGTSDTITVLRGNSPLIANTIGIEAGSTATSFTVKSGLAYGFHKGDIVVAISNGSAASNAGCMMAQITDRDASNTVLTHAYGAYTDEANTKTYYTTHEKPGGLVDSPSAGLHNYANGGELINLGPNPSLNTYSVDASHHLVVQNFMQPGSQAETVADNIISLKAQYGVDTNGDQAVDAYVDAPIVTPPTPSIPDVTGDGVRDNADLLTIKSIRLAVLSQSAQRIPACDSVNPSWAGGNFDMSGVTDWQCYRYRVFETTVPMRNMFWDPS